MSKKKPTEIVKPVLQSRTITYFEVDSHDLCKFVKQVYGYDPELVASQEWSNDSTHSIKFDKKEPL